MGWQIVGGRTAEAAHGASGEVLSTELETDRIEEEAGEVVVRLLEAA
jgi:hypothetical protein